MLVSFFHRIPDSSRTKCAASSNSYTGAINMKDSRKTGTGMSNRLVRAVCAVALILGAAQAFAYDSLIEEHVASTYGYGLLRGPAAGRTVMIAAAGPLSRPYP